MWELWHSLLPVPLHTHIAACVTETEKLVFISKDIYCATLNSYYYDMMFLLSLLGELYSILCSCYIYIEHTMY